MSRLQEFDIRSRGIATLVDDWQLEEAVVRTIWSLEDLLEATNQAVALAQDLATELVQTRPATPDEEDLNRVSDALEYFAVGLAKLQSSVSIFDRWVRLFEDQGYTLANVSCFRQSCSILAAVVAKVRAAVEAGWSELDREALSGDEILQIVASMRSSPETPD